MNFLDKHSVLVLNSLFMAIGTTTIKKAMIALNSSFDQVTPAAKAIDVVYKKNPDGSLNLNELDYWQPLTFEEWLLVEPRPNIDNIVHTPRLQIRCPTVIVTNYSKMVMRRLKPTRQVLYQIQDGKCAYTSEKISFKSSSLEHKTPKSFGGKDTFENLLVVKKEINHKRGNKPLHELGFVPIFSHKTPHPTPAHFIIKALHPDHLFFLKHN